MLWTVFGFVGPTEWTYLSACVEADTPGVAAREAQRTFGGRGPYIVTPTKEAYRCATPKPAPWLVECLSDG